MAKDLTLKFKVTDEGTIVLDRISQKISNIGKSTQQMSGALSLIKWDAIVNLGTRAIQAGEQVYDFAKKIAESAMQIQRQAEIAGMSTEQMQLWSFAAKMADVDGETLAKGFKLLSRNMMEASQGTGNAAEAFEAMGIQVKDEVGGLKSFDVIMKELMDKFAGWADGPEKIALALRIFGRSGEALIPLLNKGSAGFDEFAAAAKKMGIILGMDVIEAGTRAEDTFKRIGAQIEAGKLRLAPFTEGFAGMIESMLEKMNELKGWAERNPQVWGYMLGLIIPPAVRVEVGLLVAKGEKSEVEKAQDEYLRLEAYYKKMEKPHAPMIDAIVSDKDRIKDALSEIFPFIDALNELGVKSSLSFKAQAKDAQYNFKIVEDSFKKGEASLMDYIGAVDSLAAAAKKIDVLDQALTKLGITSDKSLQQSAKSAVNYVAIVEAAFSRGEASSEEYRKALEAGVSATGKAIPEDKTKALVKLEEETSKKLKAINKEEVGWQQKITEVIDEQTEKRNAIIGKSLSELQADLAENKSKLDGLVEQTKALEITPKAETSQMSEQIWQAFQNIKERIESTPINVSVNAGGGGGGVGTGGGGSSGGMGWESAFSNRVTSEWGGGEYPVNFDFTGTGLSPKMPLGDALRELIERFGGINEVINNLEAEISFKRANLEIKHLEAQLAQYERVMQNWLYVAGGQSFDPKEMAKLNYLMQDVKDQIEIAKMERDLTQFKSVSGSYQFGIGYVPRTGLALLHEGERVVPKNIRYGDSNNLTFNISGGDPKRIADEVAQILKYKRSSALRESVYVKH